MTKIIGSQHSKYDKAYFGWVKFEVAPSAVPQIKTELDKNEKILRVMIIETVRENTMVSAKVVFRPTDGKAVPTGTDPVKVSEEEIDKTIETLIVE